MASAVEFVGFDHQTADSPNANVRENVQRPPASDQQGDSSAHGLSPELDENLKDEPKSTEELLRIVLHLTRRVSDLEGQNVARAQETHILSAVVSRVDDNERRVSHLEKAVRCLEHGFQSLSASFDAAKPAIEWFKSLWTAKHSSWGWVIRALLISLATSDTMGNTQSTPPPPPPQSTPPDQQCAATTTEPQEHESVEAVTDQKEKEVKMLSQPKRTIFVRLIVEPEALARGHVKQAWLDSAKDHIQSNTDKNEKNEVTVEIKSDSTHEAFCKSQAQELPLPEWDPIAEAPAANSSVVTFLVIPAKQDREPFPEDCNMLQMGYLVQDRGDCDSIWIGSEFSGGVIDAVDANRKTRCYDGPAAWDKIMRKILQ